MPVIPVSQGAQVLSAGSPVPIANPGEARLLASTAEGLGKAIAETGNDLSQIARQSKMNMDKLTAESAENEFRLAVLKRKAEADAQGPLPEDATGFMAVEKFQEAARADLDAIAGNIQDPTARTLFYNGAGRVLADTSTTILAGEVKKREKINQVLQEKVISQKGAIARANPGEIAFMMDEAEQSVLTNPDLAPVQRMEMAQNARRATLQDGIQGMLLRNEYDSAIGALERFSPGTLTVEEKNKQLDEIMSAKGRFFSQSVQQEDLADKRLRRFKQEEETKAVSQFYSALSAAGNSELSRGPVLADIQKAVASGVISRERADNLINAKSFGEAANAKYTAATVQTALTTGDFNAAMDQVGKDWLLKIDRDRGGQLLRQLSELQDRQTQNPSFKSQIASGEKLLRSFATPAMVSTMSPTQKRELQERVERTVQQFYITVAENPKADPAAVSRQLYEEVYNSTAPTSTGTAPDMLEDATPEQIRKKQQDLMLEYQDKTKKGLMTREKNKEMLKQMQALELQRQKMLQLNRSQQVQPNPTRGN
jgi:hypothetical protein